MPPHAVPRDLLDSGHFVVTTWPTWIKCGRITQELNHSEDEAVIQIGWNIMDHSSGHTKSSGLRITPRFDYGDPTGSDMGVAHGIRGIMVDELPIDDVSTLDYITPMAMRINQGWQTSVRTPDNCDLIIGFSNDSGLRWSEETQLWPDADHTTTDGTMVLFVSNNSQTLHVTDRKSRKLDFGMTDADNPQIVIHKASDNFYDEGSISYDNGTKVVTLTGGTWPSYAADAQVSIYFNNNWYDVASRDSDTEITLTTGPGTDKTSDTYVLTDTINRYMVIGANDGSESRVQSVNSDLAFYKNTNKVILFGTDGNHIATADDQKLGFWGATPVVQPASADQAEVTMTTISGSGADADINSNFSALATLVNQIRSDLVDSGLIKGSA